MGCCRQRYAGQSGLTLIEVMVAVAVVSMVSIAIWTGADQTSRTRRVVEDNQDRYHQVRLAFDFMARDFASAFLSNNRPPSEFTHDTVFIGRDHGEEDRIDFTSFTHQRRYLDAKESDQNEVAYFIADDSEDRDKKNLIRRESPILDLEPLEGGQYLVVLEDVEALDIQYYDIIMNEWVDEWDNTELTGFLDRLPHQVRIKIVAKDRRGEPVTYGTQLPIPMRTPIFRKTGMFVPGPHIMVNK